MHRQIILNLIIAVMWMFLQESYTFPSFLLGYLIGFLLLLLLNRFIPDYFYFRRIWKILFLIFLFVKELILANIEVVKWVYNPKLTLQPGMIAYQTELKTNWEITLLANLITLTPGTLSVEVSRDNSTIFIHSLHVPDSDETIAQIRDSFEKAIMEVTR